MRKLKSERKELKNLVGKMKNSLEGLTSRVTAPEYRNGKLRGECQKTFT